jgi:pimeloyl-ACP methyl ester carboxylesterase
VTVPAFAGEAPSRSATTSPPPFSTASVASVDTTRRRVNWDDPRVRGERSRRSDMGNAPEPVEHGTGEPVLLLHQTPRSWDEYRDVLPLLGANHRAIAMDTLGFGASARRPNRGRSSCSPPASSTCATRWASTESPSSGTTPAA